ncbi:cytochrome P450 [Nocardioides sp. C4-1]|uniref:cytochrome P450 n=1 Tax=Nocardioides sp. C4-1 TaxID=3151851 RepID=UPI0032636AA8
MVLLVASGTPRPGNGWAGVQEARLLARGNPQLFALLTVGRTVRDIRRVPRVGWLVTDPVLARQVLNDSASFSMNGEGGVGHLWTQLFGPEMGSLFSGARHVEVRTAARDLFTEAQAEVLVERVQSGHHRALRQRLAAGGTVDVADLARVTSGRTVADLLGIAMHSDDQARALFDAGERLAALALGTHSSTELEHERVTRARLILDDITGGVEEAYRTGAPDTLLGRARGLDLGLDLARGLATLLSIAGTETGASSLSRTVALLHDTGQHRWLADDAELLEGAVREGLRVSTPAPVIGRHVARDAEVGGHTLRAGERVLVLTYVADNSVGRFDIRRPYVPETRQLWFGAGRHLCLGNAVARVQLTRLLEALVADQRPWQVVARRPARRVLVPTYAELVVRRS